MLGSKGCCRSGSLWSWPSPVPLSATTVLGATCASAKAKAGPEYMFRRYWDGGKRGADLTEKLHHHSSLKVCGVGSLWKAFLYQVDQAQQKYQESYEQT
jgi:hypothetical protein